MDNCRLCNFRNAGSTVLFEDDDVVALLDEEGSVEGHAIILPKQHFPIFEQVPDALVEKLFSMANKVSTSAFETLGVQGTNLFVKNGISAGQKVAHFCIHVIPRTEEDSIQLQWKPRQLQEEEMSTIELKLKEEHVPLSPTQAPTPTENIQHSKKEPTYWKVWNKRIP